MKKLYLFFACFFFLTFPLQALAAVGITVKDNSTTDINSVSVSVDTGTDTLESVVIPIEYSEDVTVTEVNTGTIACDSFDYTDLNNVITITCTLDEGISLEGVLANVLFTSTGEDYLFTLLEDDLDIGELELGEVTNVGEIATEEEAPIEEETSTLETEPSLIATQQETTESSTFSIDNLTEYLPYILIAGSVVLLISIIGILLSKKKSSSDMESTTEDFTTASPLADTQPTNLENIAEDISTTPTSMPQATTSEPTLKDIVNQNKSETTPTSESAPVVENNVEATPTMTPPVLPTQQPLSQSSEEQDLQDIMNSESPSIQPETVAPASQPEQAPVSTVVPPLQGSTPLDNIMPETPAPVSPEELQNRINEEINQIGSTTPPTPETQTVQQPPVTQTPPTQETTEDLPPVPPMM